MRIRAFVGYFSEMLYIYFANKLVNIGFFTGQIDERRQVLAQHVLLRATRRANLGLIKYGFKRAEVDSREFALLIRKC